jgi:hypothetical protein
MEAIPAELLEALSTSDAKAIEKWWMELADGERTEIVCMWDARRDTCVWAEGLDESGPQQLHGMLMVITARFHRPDEKTPDDDWRPDDIEYMMGRPEVYLWEPPQRVFGIGCTAHQAARSALMEGIIPADCSCPLHSPDRPMRKRLDLTPYHSIRLGLRRVTSEKRSHS